MAILKEPHTSLRLLVIEVIVINNVKFDNEKLATEFLPLLFKEIGQCLDYSKNWILLNFPTIVDFLLTRKLLKETHGESLQQFMDVKTQCNVNVESLAM